MIRFDIKTGEWKEFNPSGICNWGMWIQQGYVGGPLPFDTATIAWVNAVVTNGGTVSTPRKSLVNSLILNLKSTGIWQKLDRLWLLAAENTQSSLTDLVGLSLATAVGAPTFTTDRGYAGQDAASPTAYLDLGFNLATQAVHYTLNSAHASLWSTTNHADINGGDFLGATDGTNADLIEWYSGLFYGALNTATLANVSLASINGHNLTSRTSSAGENLYQNAMLLGTTSAVSTVVPNADNFALCFNNAGSTIFGTANNFAMISYGGSLSSGDVNNFYSALRTYMTQVGVP